MKNSLKVLTVVSAIALGLYTSNAQAGPGPHQTFAPVKSAQEAESLKVGTKIAVVCPMCGAVTTSTVDKTKSHMHSMVCGACQHSFEVETTAGGKSTVAKLVCKDPKTGKKMPLSMCAQMH